MIDFGSASAINAAFTFAQFCIQLNGVPEENKVFCNLIQRIKLDHDEAIRLFSTTVVQSHFNLDPASKHHIERVIKDTRAALNDIGKFVESVRRSEEKNGTVSMRRKLEWVLQHENKLTARERELSTCHVSLAAEIQVMRGLLLGVSTASAHPPTYEQVTERKLGDKQASDDFLAVRRRTIRRGKGERATDAAAVSVVPVEENLYPYEDSRCTEPRPPQICVSQSPNDEGWISPSNGFQYSRSAYDYHGPVELASSPSSPLSPSEMESSFFPSAPPTPFFPPARLRTPYMDRGNSVSSISSISSFVSSNDEYYRPTTPKSSRESPSAYKTTRGPPRPPKVNLYEESLPEVAPENRLEFRRSNSAISTVEEQRRLRRTRLSLINSG